MYWFEAMGFVLTGVLIGILCMCYLGGGKKPAIKGENQ